MKFSLKHTIAVFFILIAPLLIINGCKDDDDKNGPSVQATGSVEGVVRSPNGQLIGAAKVKAGIYSAKTNSNGYFKLTLPAGIHTLAIYTGSGNLFKTVQNINITSGEALNLLPVQTVLKQVGTMAYIPGNYDQIQTIIIDSLGYSASPLMVYDLGNYTSISSYDALFLNCGAMEMSSITMNAQFYSNLEMFLQNHGSIYASDFAVEMLTGDGYFRPAPSRENSSLTGIHQRNASTSCMNPKLGGFLNDSSLCTSKSGPVTMVTDADIIDQDIALALGSNTVDIYYDLINWERVLSYGPPMNVIINHSNGFGPLALRSDPFANEYGGTIFYTTFHNEPQGNISPAVNTILQYFILNL